MRRPVPEISAVRFSRACAEDQRSGLLGWVTCRVGDLVLDGITIRRTRAGRLALSFPRGRGKRPFVRPLDDAARQAIEREILGAIATDGAGAR